MIGYGFDLRVGRTLEKPLVLHARRSPKSQATLVTQHCINEDSWICKGMAPWNNAP